MKLKKLLSGIAFNAGGPVRNADISSLTSNSGEVKKGSLFVAIDGANLDGHMFVRDALKRGAVAAVVDRRKKLSPGITNLVKVSDTRKALSVAAKNFYGSPSSAMKVVGITGTNGKTTISLLIESVFNASGVRSGLIGTIEYRTGKSVVPAVHTTPGAIELNALLKDMRKNGIKAAVMEVSSHALDQKRADDILFDAAIFTNLTREHLDYHKDLKRYFMAKARIFNNLKKGGFAVINADDRYAPRLKKMIKHKCLTYGLGKKAWVTCENVQTTLDGSSFVVKMRDGGTIPVNTNLVGEHNISNVLAAAACCYGLGMGAREIKRGIENLKSVPGRLEPVVSR
ncbi:MAG: UDP-N-acetylmuramoyl-L-alanyl-D-glutamate--2,6-diaminopimelate ligase, partial [Candidatus Omnitrophica bacterium]|nr:UDP-N-acetylmuramoyl-L-alanyl-D-glutamate--2,6-diaminopimelate ligase [Candidatus Omnitrophota bacterium]